MKSIVYAIVDARSAARETLPPGLNQAPLSAIEHGGLAAIMSPVDERLASTAGVAQAIEFASVVDQLHHRFTVLPMRYGCFVHEQGQALEFLRRHERQFSDALAELEGCVEMGVRLLVRDSPGAPGTDEPASSRSGSADESRGRAYLAARRRYYDQKTVGEDTARHWAEQVQAAFSGLFVRSTWEHAARPDGQLISLLFLVKREQVAGFRDAFLRFQQCFSARALCSGPWPPYGFVEGLAQPPVAAQAEWDLLKRHTKE